MLTASDSEPTFATLKAKTRAWPTPIEKDAAEPFIIVTVVPPPTMTGLPLRFTYLNINIEPTAALGIAATISAAVAVVSVLLDPRPIAKNVPSISCAAVIVWPFASLS